MGSGVPVKLVTVRAFFAFYFPFSKNFGNKSHPLFIFGLGGIELWLMGSQTFADQEPIPISLLKWPWNVKLKQYYCKFLV